MKNPFHAQGPSDPRYYANRKELLGLFRQNITDVRESRGVTKPVNIAVIGRWGIGKTSTLYKFKDILKGECKGAKMFSAIIPIKPTCCSDADTFSLFLLEPLYREYDATADVPSKLKTAISEELKLLEKWKLAKISLNPEVERKEKSVQAITLKESLGRFWKRLRDSGFQMAVIMLDDIHYVVAEGKGELLFDLRTDMQSLSAEGTRFMFIATMPATMLPTVSDIAEPFTRLFERFHLEPFDLDGTRELISKPLQVENIPVTLDDVVIGRIQAITEGHPYFITLVMRDLLSKVQKGSVDEKKFTALYPDLVNHFARVRFDGDFSNATDAEKEILIKMARSEHDDLTPKAVGGKNKAKLLDRLVKKDLVIKVGRGKYRLYNKLFKEYVRRLKTG